MTSGEISAFVRSSLDVDSSELPDAVLDVYKREGFWRIIRSKIHWPFMERNWTLTSAANTANYSFGTGTLLLLDDIIGVNDDLQKINRIDHEEAKQMYPTAATRGRPVYWSEHYRSIYLWPIPNAAYTYTISGITQPSDWIMAGTAPTDLPEDFHELIAIWALHRAYLQQDDPETASFYAKQFNDGLAVMTARWIHAPTDRTIVMGRGRRQYRLGRLTYPNESAIGYG